MPSARSPPGPGTSLGVPGSSSQAGDRQREAARKVPVHQSCSSPQKTKQKESVCVGRGAAEAAWCHLRDTRKLALNPSEARVPE